MASLGDKFSLSFWQASRIAVQSSNTRLPKWVWRRYCRFWRARPAAETGGGISLLLSIPYAKQRGRPGVTPDGLLCDCRLASGSAAFREEGGAAWLTEGKPAGP